MNRIERYLGWVVVSHSLLVLMVLLTVLILGEFMMQLGDLEQGYTLGKAVTYSLLKIPVFGYQLLPVALLIGTLLGLGGLANHSELTILRVTGWSVGRIFWAVIKTVLVFWLLMALLGEWLGPPSETYANKTKAEALQKNISLGSGTGFWMKDGEQLIFVQRVVSPTEMRGITIYTMQKNQLVGVDQARIARFDGKNWVLQTVNHQQLVLKELEKFGQKIEWLNWSQTRESELQRKFPIDSSMIDRLQIETRYLRIDELYNYVQFLSANDLDAAVYELEFWRKVAVPVALLGMIALVFPLIFGSQRQVSMGQRMFIGILIGMGFHLLNQLFGNLSVVYQLPPAFGAFLPSLLLIVIAMVLFSRLR